MDVSAAEGEAVQIVDPWTAKGAGDKGIDYDKLIRDFGCKTTIQSQ